MAHLTVAELKRILLSPQGASWIEHHRNGISSEATAAVVKIMTNDELGTISGKLFNPLPGKGILGEPKTARSIHSLHPQITQIP